MSKKKEPEEAVEADEVIISEVRVVGQRRIWVYAAHSDDDFILTIPDGARLTFGYFNPAAAGRDKWGNPGPGESTMKTTCLRVYADSTDKRQLGAFMGVKGFRDHDSIQKMSVKRKVTVQTMHEDDGMGNIAGEYKQLTEGPTVQVEDAAF